MKITKRIHTGLISALCAISYLLVSVGSDMLTAHAEMVHQEAKEPTCTEYGWIEYWYDTETHNYYSSPYGGTPLKASKCYSA